MKQRIVRFGSIILAVIVVAALLASTAIGQSIATRIENLFVEHDLDVAGTLDVTGATTVGGTLGVTGDVTAKVLRYATAGSEIICGIQVITDTATITTGLSASTYCVADLNTTPSGDARSADCTAGTTTVTVKVRNSALTPVANTAGASVTWCALGTP